MSAGSYFPTWKKVDRLTDGKVISPEERLSWGQSAAMGIQHVIAMFGSTVLAPLLMGFDANLAIFMSGIGTLIFFLFVGGRVPSYLGSSFAFIGGVIAVTGYQGSGFNTHIGVALGAIIVCGLVYAIIGLLVALTGQRIVKIIEKLMPPVVTGAVVAVIGLNLAPIAAKSAAGHSHFDLVMALMTIISVGLIAVLTKGMIQRLLILFGLIVASVLYFLASNVLGYGTPIDFSAVQNAAWIGLPTISHPVFQMSAITVIAPVAVILIAENLGHIRAVSAMTGKPLDRYLGRAFLGDGIATMVSASFGGTGVTTYAENIGVMAVTRIYSTIVFLLAAIFAILLGFSPKFGALIHTIPAPVLGGVSVVVFGLIVVAGARIWVVNQVDFGDNKNLIVAAVSLIMGAGDFSIKVGNFSLNGIGTATFGAILLYALLNLRRTQHPHDESPFDHE